MDINNNIEYKIKRFFIVFGISLLSFVLFPSLFASVGFIFKFKINVLDSILGFVVAVFLGVMLLSKTFKKKQLLLTSLLLIGIMFLTIWGTSFASSQYYDLNYDSMTYHKFSIGKMAEGWNPLYEKVNDFKSEIIHNNYVKGIDEYAVNYYPKCLEIFAATFYKLTGDIESSKCFNYIIFIGVFVIIAAVLISKKTLWLIGMPFLMTMTSVVGAQVRIFYIDGAVYLLLLLLCFTYVITHVKKELLEKEESDAIFFICIVLLINAKYNALGYAALFSLGFYIYDLVLTIKKKKQLKEFLRFTLLAAVSVLVAIFTIGLSVYPKNFIEHGNPLYPAFGKDKIDILNDNEPVYYKGKNNLFKLYYSVFGRTDIEYLNYKKYEIKPLMSVNKTEFVLSQKPDIRVGGFGLFFGTALIVSLLLAFAIMVVIYNEHKELFISFAIILGITIILALFLNFSWWARLFPLLYFIVIIAAYLVYKYIPVFGKIVYLFLTFLIAFDGAVKYYESANGYFLQKSDQSAFTSVIEDSRYDFYAYIGWKYSLSYNLYDQYKEYADSIYIVNEYDDNHDNFYTSFYNYVLFYYQDKTNNE